MSRTARIERRTGETRRRHSARARWQQGASGFWPATSTTCSVCSRCGHLDALRRVSRGPADGGAPHGGRTRRSCWARRSTGRAGRPRGDRALRLGAGADGRGAARAAPIDVSGRPYTLFEARLPPGATGGFEHELAEEFFRALANAAKLTLHLQVQAGSNAHHMIEAAFKAFARALRAAVALDPGESGVPSTKGTLTA